jgi:hypothetical protein
MTRRPVPRAPRAARAAVGLALALGLVAAGAPPAAPAGTLDPGGGQRPAPAAASGAVGLSGDRLTRADLRTLRGYAADTWRSFEAMTVPGSGLPADNIGGDLDPGDRAGYTSPTNVGSYLWSTVAARDLRLISRREAHDRMALTLATLATLDRHDASGQFYNWYDPVTGDVLTAWPVDGSPVQPFLSSVDNGWLAMALRVVAGAEPRLAAEAEALGESMDFGFYYDAAALGPDHPAGLIRGGFWESPPPGCSVPGNYRDRGPDVHYTCHHYGAFNSETRIGSYVGIAAGQIPPEHYYAAWRTFPGTCDWSWSEQRGVGEWTEYSVGDVTVPVFQGTYSYRGMRLVPSWGGSMFEALMVPLFVPEDRWGRESWAVNHELFVQAQIEHGMVEAGYGYWGFSPSNNPAGGYREYGVDLIGMDPAGYTSDQERTTVDLGYEGCREGQPPPTEYGDGVVTPHASFLALRFAPGEVMANLAAIRADFDAYGPGGFHDAVAVRSGQVSQRHLALDQGMIMAALGNELAHDALRRYAARGDVARELRPLMAVEDFGAAPRAGEGTA